MPKQPWADRAAVALMCIGHALAGVLLLPKWLFSKYPDAARLFHEGKLRADEGADYSPLYLLLNLALSPEALRWVQTGLGCAAIVAGYLFAARLFGRVAGLLTALFLAAAAPLLVYEATLEPDLLIAALSAGALAALAYAAPPKEGGAARVWPLALGGVLVGLSAATRPAALVFLAVAVAWATWPALARPFGLRRLMPPALLLGCGIAAAMLPALAIRAAVGPELAGTMSAGAVLQMGNRPEGTGLGAQPPFLLKLHERQLGRYAPHELYRRFARAAEGEGLSAEGCERFWIKKVLAYVRLHPLAYLGLLGRKVAFFLVGSDAHDVLDARLADARLRSWPLLRMPWLGMLGLAGLLLARWRQQRVTLPMMYLASTLAVALGFYVVSRFRLASVPAFCALGGYFVSSALEAARRPRSLIAPGIIGTVAVLFMVGLSSVAEADRLVARGIASSAEVRPLAQSLAQGDLDRGAEILLRMQAAQPYVVLTQDLRGLPFESPELAAASGELSAREYGTGSQTDLFLLAVLAARSGRCDAVVAPAQALADEGYRSAIYDRSLDPALLAAHCLRRQNAGPAAFAEILRSLEQRPGTLDGLSAAIAAAKALPERAGGREAEWVDEIFALHDPLSARYALARARLEWGDAAGALGDAEAVLEKLPDSGLALYERARALLALGRRAEALGGYRQALSAFPGHAFPGAEFEAAVAEALAASPEDLPTLALATEHAFRSGRLAQARSLAQRAAALPGAGPALADRARDLGKARSSGRWITH